MYEFRLADVGEGLHEAEILRWLVQSGDMVREDQPLVEIQTDKAAVELPSPVAGRVAELRFAAGQVARVGEVLVVIEAAAGGAPAAAAGAGPAGAPSGAALSAIVAPAPGLAAGPGRRVLAAPAVRRMALERGIDLSRVPGSGPAGRVLPRDLDAYAATPAGARGAAPSGAELPAGGPEAAEAAAAAPMAGASVPAGAVVPAAAPAGRATESRVPCEERIPLAGLRRRISERMAEAWQIPHVTVFEDVDASALAALKEQLAADVAARGSKLTYLPFIIKAVTLALREHPDFNATLDLERREIVRKRYYHIGCAAAIDGGLVVPVIRDADRLSVLGLARELARLAEGARERTLGAAELSGSTFTVTNFGSFGATRGTPIINPPEVAILGVGAIAPRPWVVNDRIEVRPVMPLSLSFDHRVVDGYGAGQFMRRLMDYLSRPQSILLELV